ncbi:DUF1244 domain-containing protein [Alteromonas mediterranea]|nr:DUF1244 domain-containing protein [Alteromonas mediterranea]
MTKQDTHVSFVFGGCKRADIDYETAREVVYKMQNSEWKEKHQLSAN